MLCGKESVDDGLTLCRASRCRRYVVDFGGECFPEGSNGIDVGLGDFVVWHFNLGVNEFEFSELVDGVIDGVSRVTAIVGINIGRFGPGLSLVVGGREGVEVVLGSLGKKKPSVFGVLVVK